MNDELERIKEQNPWKEITVDSLLRSDGHDYVLDEDRDVILSFNQKNDEVLKFHLEIPPEPWQGNPLKAKVIILTLNPGYVDNANRLTALLLEKAGYAKELCEFKNKVLHLEAPSLMPEIEGISNDIISLFDSFNMLGDWYWIKMLKMLRDEYVNDKKLSERSFYEKIAVIEYCPYTSERYSPLENDCQSMIYVKNLITKLKCKDKLFVVMRGANEWEQLLVGSKLTYIVNKNRCQYLSKKNLTPENYQRILDYLTKE